MNIHRSFIVQEIADFIQKHRCDGKLSSKTSNLIKELYINFCDYFGSWFDSEQLKQEAFFHTLKAIS